MLKNVSSLLKSTDAKLYSWAQDEGVVDQKDITARALVVRMGNVIWVKVRGARPLSGLRGPVSARTEIGEERPESSGSDRPPDRTPPTTDRH